MPKRASQCLLLILCVAVVADGQTTKEPLTKVQTPYSFMGLSPGQSQEESAAIIAAMGEGQLKFNPAYCPAKLSGPGFKVCSFQHYFPLTSFTLSFVDGKSATITYTFYHRDYEVMVQSIVKKYGAAKTYR